MLALCVQKRAASQHTQHDSYELWLLAHRSLRGANLEMNSASNMERNSWPYQHLNVMDPNFYNRQNQIPAQSPRDIRLCLEAASLSLPVSPAFDQGLLGAADQQIVKPGLNTWPGVHEMTLGMQAPNFTGDHGNAALSDLHAGQAGITRPWTVPPIIAKEVALQGLALDKLQRENSRLQTELSRSEYEVQRQKGLRRPGVPTPVPYSLLRDRLRRAQMILIQQLKQVLCRESERQEFNGAKERLKNSWACDRDDFARVKNVLKGKNAEHHAHCGRISHQLKESEACNRSLREYISRNRIGVPISLEATDTRQLCHPDDQHLDQIGNALAFGHESVEEPLAQHQIRGSLDSYLEQLDARSRTLPCSSSLPQSLNSNRTVPPTPRVVTSRQGRAL